MSRNQHKKVEVDEDFGVQAKAVNNSGKWTLCSPAQALDAVMIARLEVAF